MKKIIENIWEFPDVGTTIPQSLIADIVRASLDNGYSRYYIRSVSHELDDNIDLYEQVANNLYDDDTFSAYICDSFSECFLGALSSLSLRRGIELALMGGHICQQDLISGDIGCEKCDIIFQYALFKTIAYR